MRPSPNRDRARHQLHRQQTVAIQAAIGRMVDRIAMVAGVDITLLAGPSSADALRPNQRFEARLATRARHRAYASTASPRASAARGRALAHIRRRRDAYFRTLYRSFPQRLVLGFDGADQDTATLAFIDEANPGRLMVLEPPARVTHAVRHLPDGQVDETHVFPPGTLPLLQPRLPAGTFTATTADSPVADGSVVTIRAGKQEPAAPAAHPHP
ncbi:hypothetical protein [Streptomyces sp. NPDC048242]|uniref:hypothetical protein n=1 Tax=Streptomyces sp. NPDC048242 TaxID=3155026 RepID=UPI00343F3124